MLKFLLWFQALDMAPPIETLNKVPISQPASHPPLNERILSSMTRRSVAAHPWHDLEIGRHFNGKLWHISVSITNVYLRLIVYFSSFFFINWHANRIFNAFRTWSSKNLQLCKHTEHKLMMSGSIF